MDYLSIFKRDHVNKEGRVILTLLLVLILGVIVIFSQVKLTGWKFTYYLLNYEDQFLKRGLAGEMLRLLGGKISYTFFTWFSYGMSILVLAGLSLIYSKPVRRSPGCTGLWFFLFIALTHPATFQHFYFDMGHLDSINMLITLGALLMIRHAPRKVHYPGVPLLMALTLFIHEASFFINVPVVFGYWIYREGYAKNVAYKGLAFLGLMGLTYAISTLGGFTQDELEMLFSQLSGIYGNHVKYDTLEILNRHSLIENIRYTLNRGVNISDHYQLFIVLLPAGLLLWKIAGRDRHREKWNRRLFLFLCSFGPLLLYPLGVDHFRWWALALTNLFTTMALVASEDDEFAANVSQVLFEYRLVVLIIVLTGIIAGPLGGVVAFERL